VTQNEIVQEKTYLPINIKDNYFSRNYVNLKSQEVPSSVHILRLRTSKSMRKLQSICYNFHDRDNEIQEQENMIYIKVSDTQG
jgi:hypothetical protein